MGFLPYRVDQKPIYETDILSLIKLPSMVVEHWWSEETIQLNSLTQLAPGYERTKSEVKNLIHFEKMLDFSAKIT